MAYLVIFKGLAGTGKTTLARKLQHKLRWKLVVRDDIKEQLIHKKTQSSEIGKISHQIMWEQLNNLLARNESVICDTNINHPSALPELRKISKETQANIVVIECYCSNENEHKNRLDSRKDQNLSDFWIDSWDKFQVYLKSDDNKGDYEIPYSIIRVDTCSHVDTDEITNHVLKLAHA